MVTIVIFKKVTKKFNKKYKKSIILQKIYNKIKYKYEKGGCIDKYFYIFIIQKYMLFNSYEFIFLFLPITLIIYFTLNKFEKEKLAKGFLVLASLFFYGYFNWSYLILIISSILINYFIGINIFNNQKKYLYYIGLIFNIGLLGYFKYYDFFISNINIVFKTNFNLLHIILPLGISFFTFQQISYIVDSYKGSTLKYDFLSYCLFVTFFPQLIAGPIVLAHEMLPQFENHKNKKINYENMNKGLYLFSIGLAKKVIIADSVANFANVGFDMMKSLNFIEAWLTSLSYTIQLYFDFSGYCDMAMGIALMFNIVLPVNFNSPYKSTNIQEFWKKWHITLGKFLTNYLYIPLGGNRKGELNTLRNLLIVFLVSGLWHGAGWTFIIWGFLHGISILIHRVWKNAGKKMSKLLGWFITFNLVNIFWVFFRATNVSKAINIIKEMFNIKKVSVYFFNINKIIEETSKYRSLTLDSILGNKIQFMVLFISIFIIFCLKNSNVIYKNLKYNYMTSLKINLYFILSCILLAKISQFLYFNF